MVRKELENKYNLPPLPNPITPEYLIEAEKCGLILKKNLVDGEYYYGHCRNARVARWNTKTQEFTYIRTKFGSKFPETIKHPEDDDGFDLFKPVSVVEPEEDEKVVFDYEEGYF